ncbi:ferrous iron transport protein B [bacterium]|nr:ferrous iron transport protein B [bacterium]
MSAASDASATDASAPSLKVALVGNPNTGKSTLFNALAGMNTRVGNFPGVTVEKRTGTATWGQTQVELIDLPGTYSLSARSLDELVSVTVLLGEHQDVGQVDAVVCIADATNLERHLFLLGQLLEMTVPVVLVLNMWDTVQARGIECDVEELRERLGIPVVVTEANRRRGLDELKSSIVAAANGPSAEPPKVFPDVFVAEVQGLKDRLTTAGKSGKGKGAGGSAQVKTFHLTRALLDPEGAIESRLIEAHGPSVRSQFADARERLRQANCKVPFVESEVRYAWARQLTDGVVKSPAERARSATDVIDAIVTHRVFGLLIFVGLMFGVFQALYSWAGPLMDLCEATQGKVSGLIESSMPPGAFRSLLTDGIVAGVGGVLIFVPQIAMLFLFIAVLEDCGYMARAAYIMDRAMARFGLSGKSFLPLMSSFACAVPGIMATRIIDNKRERMVTILIAPLMSCSARLPVYLLLIGAFVPETAYLGGWVSVRGLVLLAMISLGAFVAIPVAWILKKTFFRGDSTPFVMELPEYKMPSFRVVLARVFDSSKAFVIRAGTLIFAATILIWACGYFPGDHTRINKIQQQLSDLPDDDPGRDALAAEANIEGRRLIEGSLLGRAGHLIEPIVKPLGWDWRIGIGALASFPAREVIISTLGTIYSLGGDVSEEDAGLRDAMKASTWPDGRPVYNMAVALSIMVFFALCAQCVSTILVIRRETNSWGWAVFSFVYMTGLAWVGAFVTYQTAVLI